MSFALHIGIPKENENGGYKYMSGGIKKIEILNDAHNITVSNFL